MKFLYTPLKDINGYDKVIKTISEARGKVGIIGPSESQKAHFSSAILEQSRKKAIFVTYNEMQARMMYEDFSFLLGDKVLLLSAAEYILYDIEAKSYESSYNRLDVLGKISDGNYQVVVVPAEALCQRLMSPEKFASGRISFNIESSVTIDELADKLLFSGYERVETVVGKGQFAIRGGIFDIFPVNYQEPVRIDFFGDEIDSIRSFDVDTQRSTENIKRVDIIPAREIFYDDKEKDEIVARVQAAYERQLGSYIKGDVEKSLIKNFKSRIGHDIERFKNYSHFPGIDRYIPIIFKEYSTVLDYAKDAIVLFDEPGRISERINNVDLEHGESCRNMLEKGLILNETGELYTAYEKFYRDIDDKTVVYFKTLGSFAEEKIPNSRIINIATRTVTGISENADLMVEQVREWKQRGSRIVVLSAGKGRGERICEIFRSHNIESAFYESYPDNISAGQVIVTNGALHKSFEYPEIGLVVLSDSEFFTRSVKTKRRKKKKGKPINVFTDLTIGDYVVHEVHGIGQYMGLEQITVNNITRDYIKIRYSDSGFLYVPTNQMELVQKYIGSEGKVPKLNKLGSNDWAKAKKKVKESLKELAEELVRLYAKRQSSKGFAFSADTVWQKQFEEAFPYEETDDQLKCIEEIKADMESERPMERLLCGDVGYGKTEVAIRAAFKAVMDGKQVAVLVPTTILARQHYYTIKQRMGDFPVRVDYICRFRTPSEQREIVRRVRKGEIDILIGTHRLISKDIEFKDLGLLIVDEEQRFGVAHKEKLKTLKPNIDILTLSATPIPRTLHMSLVAIRDISTIEEPPEERFPVQTYVMEYNAELIRDAIYREMARKGQVFYLYNKVNSIDIKAYELKALVPEARIAIAHGQMGERELEDIMQSFLEGNYDILVCTTIIESGLDMPNVNTMIVEESDKLGLAQLYQIRGRVGRSNKLAYAYLTYKKDKQLNEISEKRLQAIREFTEFGSGFKIAMRDLEIRGAGNLLGSEQHGHMESVGYDMYCKLLDRAVREIRGSSEEEDIPAEDFTIDISIDAYIGKDYIPREEERLEIYKKISLINDDEDVGEITDELIDRYGDLPEEIENLISIARLKSLARKKGFISLTENKDLIIMKFAKNASVNIDSVGKIMENFKRKVLFNAGAEPYLAYRINETNKRDLLNNLKKLFEVY